MSDTMKWAFCPLSWVPSPNPRLATTAAEKFHNHSAECNSLLVPSVSSFWYKARYSVSPDISLYLLELDSKVLTLDASRLEVTCWGLGWGLLKELPGSK